MSTRGRAAAAPALPALARTLSGQLRRMLGLRQTLAVGPVRYRERTPEPLRHALSRKGAGSKEYDAYFRSGRPLRIHATATRHYADLAGPRLLPVYQRTSEWLTPGLRVALLWGGTGYAAAWIAERVGPSGAIVSLDPDEESITFARRRYASPNIAFEIGGVESLAGETDGAFDAVIAVDPIGDHFLPLPDPSRDATIVPPLIAELWRVVGAPGWLYLSEAGETGTRADALSAGLKATVEAPVAGADHPDEPEPAPQPPAQTAMDARDGWISLIARRETDE